ncbi:type II toxin-antitoxin system VapC family toxin [Petrimonas sp.]|uniref:type II toxin-antitoxin system VapC family toxin n=1 Tax=Petrimonas sp. TaxID=2023866 RepID=UPI003F515F85
MRYLLDTNILIFLTTGDEDNISKDVGNILCDYGNLLHTSSLCIVEMIYLYKKHKIKTRFKSVDEILHTIEQKMNIKIIHTKPEHLSAYSQLTIAPDHNDQIDHFIIAQSITEKMSLVSSDRKFKEYPQLNFVYNRR